MACKGFHFLPVLLSLSLRLSASVKKCLPLVVGSHSNFLLSQLDGGQPNAELQKGAAARKTAYVIEFPAVTYINLNISRGGIYLSQKCRTRATRRPEKTGSFSSAAAASLEDNVSRGRVWR